MPRIKVNAVIGSNGTNAPTLPAGLKTDIIERVSGGAFSFNSGSEISSIRTDTITDVSGTGTSTFTNGIPGSAFGGITTLIPRVQVLSSSSTGTIISTVSPDTFGGITPEFVMYFASAYEGGISDLRLYSVNSGSSFSETTLVLGGGSDDTDQGATADIYTANIFVLPYKENQDFYVRYNGNSSGPPNLYIWAIGYQS